MSGISLTVTGLTETINAVNSSSKGIPSALYVAMTAAMKEVRTEVAKYPPNRAPKNPKYQYIQGSGMMYVPTKRIYKLTSENYGKTTTARVLLADGVVTGFVNSKAKYASRVRGDREGKGQAWMHVGHWKPLKVIADDETPLVKARLDVAVEQAMKRSGL